MTYTPKPWRPDHDDEPGILAQIVGCFVITAIVAVPWALFECLVYVAFKNLGWMQ